MKRVSKKRREEIVKRLNPSGIVLPKFPTPIYTEAKFKVAFDLAAKATNDFTKSIHLMNIYTADD